MERFSWWRALLRFRGHRTFVRSDRRGYGVAVLRGSSGMNDRAAEYLTEMGWEEEL